MGQEVCRTVLLQSDLELVAAVDPQHGGAALGGLIGADAGALVVSEAVDTLVASGVEAVVDFTRLDAARSTLAFCGKAGIHAVVGTTGFSDDDLADLATWFAGPGSSAPNCILAANFAIGAVLMMRFAELAAPWFDGAEIIELHHDGKLDAPSGTAMTTARRIAAARAAGGMGEFAADRTTTEVVADARGGAGPGGVRLHSVRLAGLVAHQEVLFGGIGQSLTLRHDSYERSSFMDGVMLALRSVPDRPGLTVGLESLLGL
jgi:4-hydroxy-tetrahydrodipicolinate reductase